MLVVGSEDILGNDAMRRQSRVGLSLCLALISSMAGCAASHLEQNKQIVLAQARAYNARDIDAFRATMTPDIRRHCQATPDTNVRSASDFVAFIKSDLQTFPDGRLHIDRMVAEGDLVGAFGRFIGTQDGALGPFPPSGKQMVLDFSGVFRIENDRIAEIWITWDNLTALTQLGHWPPNGETFSPPDRGTASAPADAPSTLAGGTGVVFVPGTTLLPCHVRAPADFDSDQTYDIVIGLHGFGSTARSFSAIGAPFVDAGMLFAAPQAPTAFLVDDRIGYDWDRAHDEAADSPIRASFGRTSADYITSVVQDLKRRYTIGRVYLLGFSQGGAYAYIVGIHHPDTVSGIVVVGMGFETAWFDDGALEAGSGLPVLIVHSRDDQRVPLAYAEVSAKTLRDLGYDVTMQDYQGGHRITDEVVDRALDWIQRQ